MADQSWHFPISDAVHVFNARREGMLAAQGLGFDPTDATKIAVVISELGRNIVNYAGTGSITVVIGQSTRGASIRVIADDRGPGIADIDHVMAGGNSSSGGLGLGLAGSRRLMDAFDIRSEVGKGTTITAEMWLR